MTFDFALGQADTHVWVVSLAALETQAEIFETVLNPHERAAAARMHFARDRHERIVSRVLLRLLAGAYCDTSATALEVRTAASGKPYLTPRAGAPPFEFNVSHSAGLALYAFSRIQLGIDLERNDAAIEFTPIARQVFSPAEMNALEHASAARARELFYLFWTAKEAFVKATGVGLSEDLVKLDLSRLEHEAGMVARSPVADDDACSIWPIDAAEGFSAALAICGAPATAALRLLRVDAGKLALGKAWSAIVADHDAVADALRSAIAGSAPLELTR